MKFQERLPCPERAIRFVTLCILFLIVLPFQESRAADCPEGNTILFMPTPKGSQLDALYSLLLPVWQEKVGSGLNIEYKPGRGGSYAVSSLLDSEADGCAYSAVELPSLILISEDRNSMYEASSLALPGFLASAPNALWVHEESPIKSVADLVRHARAVAETGRIITIAGTGSLTEQHLATLQLNRAAGIVSMYIPSLGSAEAAGFVKEGKASACWGYALRPETMPGMRALAVAGEQRSAVLPEIPTFREIEVELVSIAHFGLALLAETDEQILSEAAKAVAFIMADNSLRAKMLEIGFAPLALSPKDTPAFIEAQVNLVNTALEEYPLIPKTSRR